MTNTELKELRQSIGFDMRSTALCLGVPSSTYQRYEDGTAQVPEKIGEGMLNLKQINETFAAEAPARIDARIALEYPHGIISV